MSFYADYLKEKTVDSIIETDYGFATYRYINEGRSVYIIDLYIVPEERKNGRASALAEMICKEAKAKGCIDLMGSVIPSNKGSSASVDVLRSFGMDLQSASQDFIAFRKAI